MAEKKGCRLGAPRGVSRVGGYRKMQEASRSLSWDSDALV